MFGVDRMCLHAVCTGSPFQFTVGPITDGGAHKVRAIGPGLERGEVNRPSTLSYSNIAALSETYTVQLHLHQSRFGTYSRHLEFATT